MEQRSKTGVATDDYIEGVRQSYYGEIVAEGFYRHLSLGVADAYRRTALLLIAEVERTTHRRLEPFAARFDIWLADEERELRIKNRIRAQGAFDWDTFIAKAHREWPAYLGQFEKLERAAQARGERGLAFLVDHEKALLDFVRLELARPGSEDALVPLTNYIAAAI